MSVPDACQLDFNTYNGDTYQDRMKLYDTRETECREKARTSYGLPEAAKKTTTTTKSNGTPAPVPTEQENFDAYQTAWRALDQDKKDAATTADGTKFIEYTDIAAWRGNGSPTAVDLKKAAGVALGGGAFWGGDDYRDQDQQDKLGAFYSKIGDPPTLDKYCGNPRSGLKRLRKILMDRLHQMAKREGIDNCGFVCEEDKMLDKLRKKYQSIVEAQNKCLKESNPNCAIELPQCLQSFDDDARIDYLKSKKRTLGNLTFNFLHKICDNSINSNPLVTIPENLIPCSGIHNKDAKFFNDPDLAAIGRQLAGPGQKGSPADRGFCADFFPVGTIAQSSSECWWTAVAVPSYDCYEKDEASRRQIRVKWTKANLMEVAKACTHKDLSQRITARKRSLLNIAKQMIGLQSRMYSLQPVLADGIHRPYDSPCNKPCIDGRSASAVIDLAIKRAQHKMMVKEHDRHMEDCRDNMALQSQLCRPRPVRRKSKKKKKK